METRGRGLLAVYAALTQDERATLTSVLMERRKMQDLFKGFLEVGAGTWAPELAWCGVPSPPPPCPLAPFRQPPPSAPNPQYLGMVGV